MTWKGFRQFRITHHRPESASAASIELEPVDGEPIAPFRPGQHLMLRRTFPGSAGSCERFYTISNAPGAARYRLTIKRMQSAPAVFSSWVCEHCRVGDVLEARAPAGEFTIDLQAESPLCLIAGGIGITPMISMLLALDAEGPLRRDVWLFYTLREPCDHVFADELNEIAQRQPRLRYHVFYKRNAAPRVADTRCQGARLDVPLMEQLGVPHEAEFLICGPGPMMNTLTNELRAWSVQERRIRVESFVIQSEADTDGELLPKDQLPATAAARQQVEFVRSGVTVAWDAKYKSILELAEAHGITINSGCWYGDCGACMTRLLEGEVKYNHRTMARPDPGCILACSCKPLGWLRIDA